MADAQTAAGFLRAVAAGFLKEDEPPVASSRAREELDRVLAGQKSLVLDVQFTGFAQKGALVGGVDPRLLRAAGQLIMHRVSRVGFTGDASADDLAVLVGAASRAPGELGGEGILGALRAATARGIYLTTTTGETYRPPAPPKPVVEESAPAAVVVEEVSETIPPPALQPAAAPEESTAGTGPVSAEDQPAAPSATPSGGTDVLGFELLDEAARFSDFEILEAFPELAPEPVEAQPTGAATAPPPPTREMPAEGDLFHFFRAAGHAAEPDPAQIPGLLAAAGPVAAFEEAAQAAARAAARQLSAGEPERAVELLEALVIEAQRPDRSRLFRDAATQALRKVGSDGTLHYLVDLLQQGGSTLRERVLGISAFVGGDALVLLEGLLFRTGDPEMRRAVFRALAAADGMLPRLQSRTMTDPAPARTRSLLEIAVATLPPETALKWAAEAAGHGDAAIRTDAARHAASAGGRGGLRILVDLVADTNPTVRRAAVDGLGALGDAASVPFLARTLHDTGDEDLQAAIIAALGATGSSEVVPHLLAVLNRRQLFGGKKLQRVKGAALAALGRIPTPAAREVLGSFAAGKDADLAAEARRILSGLA